MRTEGPIIVGPYQFQNHDPVIVNGVLMTTIQESWSRNLKGYLSIFKITKMWRKFWTQIKSVIFTYKTFTVQLVYDVTHCHHSIRHVHVFVVAVVSDICLIVPGQSVESTAAIYVLYLSTNSSESSLWLQQKNHLLIIKRSFVLLLLHGLAKHWFCKNMFVDCVQMFHITTPFSIYSILNKNQSEFVLRLRQDFLM